MFLAAGVIASASFMSAPVSGQHGRWSLHLLSHLSPVPSTSAQLTIITAAPLSPPAATRSVCPPPHCTPR